MLPSIKQFSLSLFVFFYVSLISSISFLENNKKIISVSNLYTRYDLSKKQNIVTPLLPSKHEWHSNMIHCIRPQMAHLSTKMYLFTYWIDLRSDETFVKYQIWMNIIAISVGSVFSLKMNQHQWNDNKLL